MSISPFSMVSSLVVKHAIFTTISGIGFIILLIIFIQFLSNITKPGKKNKRSVDPLIAKCASLSLLGYTAFVLSSFVFYLLQSLYDISPLSIGYNMLLCEAQTFNIALFMTGKLANYFYFMALVHVAFKSSSLAYNPRMLFGMATVFLILMCTIGGFYAVLMHLDFMAIEDTITSPADCDKMEVSTYSTITIWTGASCDALWGFTCWLLFYLRLRKLTEMMTEAQRKEQLERIQMEQIQQNISVDSSCTTESIDCPEIGRHSGRISGGLETVIETAGTFNVDNTSSSPPPRLVPIESITVNSNHSNHSNHHHQNGSISFSTESVEEFKSMFRKKGKRTSLQVIRRQKSVKPDIVYKFLPIMLKLTILSAWSSITTFALGFGLWTVYPTLSSVIDSTVNALCIYLSFGFTKRLYERVCFPFISCKKCSEYRIVLREVDNMENDSNCKMSRCSGVLG